METIALVTPIVLEPLEVEEFPERGNHMGLYVEKLYTMRRH